MIRLLFLLFIVLPLVELSLLTALARYTSLTTTILFIVITGLLGTWLVRTQGLSAYRRIQQDLSKGRVPTQSLLDGLLVLLAGVLLISPGVLTDVVGVILLIPPTRFLFRLWLLDWFRRHVSLLSFMPSGEARGAADVVDAYATPVDRDEEKLDQRTVSGDDAPK